ncbi:MAG: WYL domain-containing protein [Gemmatimonadota bacterium]|nr:WYL domain-containing protein [Gemmatimonadota bacterium]
MSPREPADRQLERVLHILPEAAREGGVAIAELAESLGVDPKRIVRDLEEVTARGLYVDPPLDVEITIGDERITVWTTGEFRRPVKLSPREALALTMGLRLLADGAEPDRAERLRALARRMDAGLAAFPAEALAERFAVAAGDPGGGALDGLREAARERRPCRLSYLKPEADRPERRVLHPYAIVHAGGFWYALGHSEEAGEDAATSVRAFRLDRILALEPLDDSFDPPEDFDPSDYVDEEGHVFRADEVVEVAVRYSPRVARWIEEEGIGERLDDGGVVVRHEVADPDWLVRHVLYHGAEAEVLEPPEMRELVRRAVEGLAEPVGA